MIICHCNTIAHEAFEAAVLGSVDALREKATLKQAVGHVWRHTVEENRSHINPLSCTVCFDEVAKLIQSQGLFTEDQIPEYDPRHSTCPRRAECGLSLLRGCE